MTSRARRWALVLCWALLAAGGAAWLAQARLAQLRDAFETHARIAHRLLSQQAVQNDAILASLVLLQPDTNGADAAQRLPSVYPRILRVLVQRAGKPWPDDLHSAMGSALATSQQTRGAALVSSPFDQARYWLVQAGEPASFALQLDLRASVPWDEWPMDPATSPVRVVLAHAGQQVALQAGRSLPRAWHYRFAKTLASPSQPFEMQAARDVGFGELPWLAMLAWAALTAAAMAAAVAAWHTARRQREARRRAEELVRLGQVARLGALGELAAGMAHELNQPLTALLASTQATQRLLREPDPDLPIAQAALERAVQQARRAAAVVGRLRTLVERPDPTGLAQPVSLHGAAQEALHLLAPELQRRSIATQLHAEPGLPDAQADPVALQQILHNLLMNAAQALEQVPAAQRRIALHIERWGAAQLQLAVRDSGPGVAEADRDHVFEPFYSTRKSGLGLGLPLCESLAQAMGGSLVLAAAAPGDQLGGGATFVLTLPIATPQA